jgi:hypothetical protein
MQPRDKIHLIAIASRRPEKLFGRITPIPIQAGVYDLQCCVRDVRLIVCREIPKFPHNALWLLFSGIPDHIEYAVNFYKNQKEKIGVALNQLVEKYNLEGIPMSYTVEDFNKDYIRGHLHCLSPQERVMGLKPEERFIGLKPEERFIGLKPEERFIGLKPEERFIGLKPEERLDGLNPEELLELGSKALERSKKINPE